MKTQNVNSSHHAFPDAHHDLYSRTVFGFWIYIMTDLILFGTLFATYAVLKDSTFGGPSAHNLFNSSYTLVQTIVLLIGALMAGLGGAAAHRHNKRHTLLFFTFTFLIGLTFLGMMYNECSHLTQAGHGWDQSAFLSIYFTIIGTLAVHIIFGLVWIPVLLIPVWKEEEISHASLRRLTCLRMFWQFLNIVWVFIFCFIYLMGEAK